MNKNQQLNIKKMIFELGCGGCKNHFFDRMNDVRGVERFFANAQNDAGVQTGRSMLEMLGVLAIIGVLSVGAVMGFRQAMNRHKANVILNDVSLAFEELATHETTGAISRYQVTAFTPESGHTLYAKRDAEDNSSVEVQGVAKGVCEVLIQYDKTELYTQISDTAGAKLTACADDQTMVFGVGIDDSDPTPEPEPEPEPTDPCDGKTCLGHGTCSDGVCTCSDGYTDPDCGTAPECNSVIACASPKTCSVDYHCECPKVANCKTQNTATCDCITCEDGFEKNDAGECVKAATKCGDYNCPTGWTCVDSTCEVYLTTAGTTDKLECMYGYCLTETLFENYKLAFLDAEDGLVGEDGSTAKSCDDESIPDELQLRCKTLYNAWREYHSVN